MIRILSAKLQFKSFDLNFNLEDLKWMYELSNKKILSGILK